PGITSPFALRSAGSRRCRVLGRLDPVPRVPPRPAHVCRCRPARSARGGPYELSGGDMLRRNVRVTVLPHSDQDAGTIEREPGMLAFSSDHPHVEGSPTPIDELAPVPSTPTR